MKKNIQTTLIALFALLPLGMQAQSVVTEELYKGTQILNSDFETWADKDGNAKAEPRYWHSFESASGGLAGLAAGKIKQSNTKKGGNYSCQLKSSSILGIVANGTMTTGQLNAASGNATDPANHASLDISSTEKDKYGDPFYALLNSCPDSLVLWVQFSQGTANANHPHATVSAAITNGTYYQEPAAKGVDYSEVLVGYAENRMIATTGGKWERLSIPFSYDKEKYKSNDPKAIMVTMSTNADAGQGSGSDVLLIDDLELIYTQKVEIPDCGYYAFTNIAQKNHAVVMPEELVGYALGLTANGNPIVTKTYKAGDVIPYETSLLLEGKADDYYFKTTLYETGESPELNDDGKLVDGTELNDPIEGYQYYHLVSDVDGNPEFIVAEKGLKVMPGKALLRVKTDLAAESYNHVLTESSVEGDVDGNGVVEATDVKALVDRLLGNELGMKGFLVPDADVNGDKTVDVADVTQLINILLHE